MTPSPRVYTAKRRSLHHNALPSPDTKSSTTVPSDYGSDIDIDTDLLTVSAQARSKETDLGSDYGSDFDIEGEAILEDLLGEVEGRTGGDERGVAFLPTLSAGGRESLGTTATFFSCDETVGEGLRDDEEQKEAQEDGAEREDGGARREIVIALDSKKSSSSSEPDVVTTRGSMAPPPPPDTRSPLERFRSPPMKPLSVSDLVSPAWCELQYWFTLTSKLGRKKRTPAMKAGTKVHAVLEAQVHDVVPVDVTTREDGWGLRIWNVIQGLRTLRATGMTRELEVWGVIDGQVVNGIIDEIGIKCPDPELEEALELSKTKQDGAKMALPPEQKTILDYYDMPSSHQHDTASSWLGSLAALDESPKKIYITDVKTRMASSLPKGGSLKPTNMQLHIYHHLFVSLATNSVQADTIFDRYKLKANATFTDGFIAAIAGLEDNFISETVTDEPFAEFNSRSDSVSELSQHNTLTLLWSLMMTEFARTVPSVAHVGNILQAEFRKQSDGSMIGNKVFPYEEGVLREYIEDVMKWWRGEREARGVDMEDAWKCGSCEFKEGCEWRESKVKEAVEKFRERQESLANKKRKSKSG
ncbi:putative tripeptidyl-peptidase [Venturia nashicola]|nr:putative tripeptidyl-peptidase [Venturia nashicola]